MPNPSTPAQTYETNHVHTVYEEIASHFSSTRYKPWPIVQTFLQTQPQGSIGADIGCGNGKYLREWDVGVDENSSSNSKSKSQVWMVGCDRSTNLAKIASKNEPHSVIVADTLALPHPNGVFDFAICIAVIHHLSTAARRVEAVKCVLDLLRRPCSSSSSSTSIFTSSATPSGPGGGGGDDEGGKALIYVWALEQKDSRRGWDEGHEQDVMVPWVLKQKKEKQEKGRRKKGGDEEVGAEETKQEGDKTFLRYYHLYRKGELESDIEQAGGVVLESGYEKDNWWAIARLR